MASFQSGKEGFMYIQNSEKDLRKRLGKIRNDSSLWACFWAILAIALAWLVVWPDATTNLEKFLKGIYGSAMMASWICMIIMLMRVVRFTRYRLNRTKAYPINDYNRIYR